jgi:iron(III) transport system permease protein
MEAIGQMERTRGFGGRGGSRFDAKWLVIGLATGLVAWLALVPLIFLVYQSFMTPETAFEPAVFTLDNFANAYGSAETFTLFVNSVQYGVGTALLAMVIGTSLAWLNERTNTPFKSVFFALSVIPLVIPNILFTVSWIMLASPRIGILNAVVQGVTGTDAVLFDIYSMGGMIWVDGLQDSPIAFLMMTAAFRAMDPSLEESAMMSGASVSQTIRRITLRLTLPASMALFLILFVRAVESFETPALLGLPVGIEVFTSAIYQAIHRYPSDIGLASAYAITLLMVTSGGILLQSRITKETGRFQTVTGKGFRPRQIDLGLWRHAAAALYLLYIFVLVILPFLVLLWASLQKFYSVPTWAALSNISLDAYRKVLAYPGVDTAVMNSAMLSVTAATLIMLATSVVCWIVVKTRIRGRWLLDALASLPLVFPGIVLGLSIMICYLTIGGPIYGSIWILLIAYLTRFLPYGMRYNMTSMLQIHKELEESAAMSGASWWITFRRILLPLLKPGLLAGWIYIVIVSVRELSSSILLYSPGNEVIAIIIWELWQNGQTVELAAFGVMLIGVLFVFVMIAQQIGRRFGIREG